MSNNLKAFLLALFSGLLLWIAWPPHSLGWVSFIAFVPLLFIHDFYQKGLILKIYLYSLNLFFTFTLEHFYHLVDLECHSREEVLQLLYSIRY